MLDRHVLALGIPGLLQTLEKRNGDVLVVNFSGLGAEDPDQRHHMLLRPRRTWPRRRAPEPRDEFLPSDHSIASSALSRIDCGTVRPSALAVLRFTAISNFVGNCTGRSPGFAPRRMRST